MATKVLRRMALAAVVFGTCASAISASQDGPKVAPRDQLDITVWGVEHYSRRYPVGPDGTLDFPDLGKVKVGGLTPRQIEEELAKRLRDGGFLLSPQVTVTLEQTQNQRVTVSGAVTMPGVIQYAGEMTVFEAIVRAGQATEAASDEVLIIRASSAGTGDAATGAAGQPGVLTVDLKQLRNGDLSNNPTLADGDMIIVREAQDFFISGEVRAPGAYPARAGLTVEQALALAGGLTERGSTRRIEIKRVGADEVLKGVQLDDPVKPGDTIKVNRAIM